MACAVGIAILDCIWLVPIHLDAAALILGVNAAVAVCATVGFVALGTIARRRAESVVLILLIVADAAILTLGFGHPSLGLVVLVFLLLLPTILTLLMPWATKIQVEWLALHAAVTLGFIALAPAAALPGSRIDSFLELSGFVILSSAVSALGHVTFLQARVLSFEQIARIRGLNRRAGRDRAALDRLNAMLTQETQTDELTGLKNRLSLKQDLVTIRSRITRRGERYALLMLDLDRFKSINDQLGHVAGDLVLQGVALALAKAVRPEDAVYRYGGEEFLVLARIVRASEAINIAERLRRVIEDQRIPHPGNPPHGSVTVSAGATVIGPEDLANADDEWIARADAPLYRAKANGRNRCEADVIGTFGQPARMTILHGRASVLPSRAVPSASCS
jgi:diguanylate cyclase (GGDEF)-like protein